MGIDVYLQWDGQTEAEKHAQITGFSITSGDVGYLREAYHGGPYVTQYLVEEAEGESDAVEIPAAILRERLPTAVMIALYRNHVVYEQEGDPSIISLDGGLNLFEAVEAALKEASNREALDIKFNEEQLRHTRELIASRNLPDYALSFVDFVILAEKKEAETGKPCSV